MSPACMLFVLLLGALWSSPLCVAQLYYVKSAQSTNTSCPTGEPCHTLEYYAQHSRSLLSGKGNVTLLFLDGVHVLREQSLVVSNTTNLTFSGMIDSSNHRPVVNLLVGWNFTWVDSLQIRDLGISSNVCGPDGGDPIIVATHIRRYTHLNIEANCCVFNVQMTEEVELHHSVYTDSLFNKLSYSGIQNLSLMVSYCSFVTSFSTPAYVYKITITLNGGSTSVASMFNGSIISSYNVGVAITGKCQVLSLNISKSSQVTCATAFNSQYLLSYFEFTTIMEDSSISWFTADAIDPDEPQILGRGALWMKNCTVEGWFLPWSLLSNISISQSSFQTSTALYSSELVHLTNVTFFDRCILLPITASKVIIDGCVFENLTDYFSPLLIANADISFSGETVFKNNTGYQGGALNLYNSRVYLTNESRVVFENNTARDKGGAIYISNPLDLENIPNDFHHSSLQCTFSLAYDLGDGGHPNSVVSFKYNIAPNGGSNIYGSSLKSNCFVSPNGQNYSYQLQSEIFEFDNKSHFDLSSVSSDPMRVCLCENGTPLCANYSYIVQHKKHSPGEIFTVDMALVGADFGTIVGSVVTVLFSKEDEDGEIEKLPVDDEQAVRVLINNNCSTMQYTVHSKNESGTILWFLVSDVSNLLRQGLETPDYYTINDSTAKYFSKGEIDSNLAYSPVLLNITLQPCPLGFFLNTTASSCQCIQTLLDVGVSKCVIFNGEARVTRSGTIWVSYPGVSNNESDGVVVNKYCPRGYCKAEELAVNLLQPDSQCAFDHSGVLCGGCSPNLSLALGSSNCLHCSDSSHIALLLPFVVAGIVLVLLIKLLDFTITKGAINGLILYANILWANQSVFFPYTTQQSSPLLHFFATFIAWLNLDLGIETCFINGLDMYWKTWLQFVFPLYIWGLAGLIILACRYSGKATKLFGNSSVHILATMFLLSYTKLQRTIITSLEFAVLDYPDGIRFVWLSDGNLLYFGVRHSFLFIAAMVVLIVFWLPYTSTILLVPWLRKYGNFRWVNKLKPFYDAHYGPLKDKHQYWIGLTLLVRAVLAVSSVTFQVLDPTINILLTAILSSLLLYIAGKVIYKSLYVSLLEASFIVNLVVLCSGLPYCASQDARSVLTSVSVGISFLTFLLMLVVQVYTRIKTSCQCKVGAQREYENINSVNNSNTASEPTRSAVSINDGEGTRALADYSRLRESILESKVL